MRILEIRKIKNTIRRSEDLLQGNNPIVLDEEIVETTNCYAYSLGIMYHGIMGKHFHPGFTENLQYYRENAEELMEKVIIDLRNLGISFRKLELEEKKELKENEYLVKVFHTPPNKKIPAGDYHFIRQDRQTGIWFHKIGWYRQPEIVRSITEFRAEISESEPLTFTAQYDYSFFYVYNPVAYLAIAEV